MDTYTFYRSARVIPIFVLSVISIGLWACTPDYMKITGHHYRHYTYKDRLSPTEEATIRFVNVVNVRIDGTTLEDMQIIEHKPSRGVARNGIIYVEPGIYTIEAVLFKNHNTGLTSEWIHCEKRAMYKLDPGKQYLLTRDGNDLSSMLKGRGERIYGVCIFRDITHKFSDD